jgi:hypothetical protein
MSQNPNDPKIKAYYTNQRKQAETKALGGDAAAQAEVGKIGAKLAKGGNKSVANRDKLIASGGKNDQAVAANVEDDPVSYIGPDAVIGGARLGMAGAKMAGKLAGKFLGRKAADAAGEAGTKLATRRGFPEDTSSSRPPSTQFANKNRGRGPKVTATIDRSQKALNPGRRALSGGKEKSGPGVPVGKVTPTTRGASAARSTGPKALAGGKAATKAEKAPRVNPRSGGTNPRAVGKNPRANAKKAEPKQTEMKLTAKGPKKTAKKAE